MFGVELGEAWVSVNHAPGALDPDVRWCRRREVFGCIRGRGAGLGGAGQVPRELGGHEAALKALGAKETPSREDLTRLLAEVPFPHSAPAHLFQCLPSRFFYAPPCVPVSQRIDTLHNPFLASPPAATVPERPLLLARAYACRRCAVAGRA
jgi:hypothetical protein